MNEYCPMLVHRTRLSEDQRPEGALHDGFYLAQRSGDASRFPLRINDLINIDNNGIDFKSNAGVEVYACEGQSTTLLGSYTDRYSDADTTASGNLLLRFYGSTEEVNISPGNYLTLTFGQESCTLDIYLPRIYLFCDTTWIWVAQDGSSYYGRSDHGYGDPDQDAYFAMQYAMPSISGDTGLAMSAYDGRYAIYGSQDSARSPAIDKGAVKVTPSGVASTNSDVTCSNFASMGWTNSEDTVDNNRDCATTLRWIAETTAANYTDPVGKLDLGYHYKKGVAYTTDIVSTFRFNNRTYVYDIIGDYLYNQSEIFKRVVSGKFDTASTLNNRNLVVFPASGLRTTDQYIALGYHVQGTPIVKGIAEYSCPTTWDRWVDTVLIPAMWINHVDTKSAPDGMVFATISLTKQTGSNYYEYIYIYRYDDTSSQWNTVASLSWMNNTAVNGLALSCDTQNLWIALALYQRGGSDLGIWVKTVSRTTSGLTLQPTNFTRVREREHLEWPINMTYDETYSDSTGAATVRILYIDPTDLQGRYHALRVELRNGIPTLTDDKLVLDVPIPEHGGGTYKLEIVYNPNDATGGYNQSYSLVHTGGQQDGVIHGIDLDAHDSANEQWNEDTSYLVGHHVADLTYRGNGNKLVVWTAHIGQYSPVIYSNAGDIPCDLIDATAPVVYTNPVNKRDIIASWHSWYDYDPNDSSGEGSEEGVIVCREIYP